ncbi:MAG: hypothetical protein JW839_03630, partial [Candidatus Lokiarchaeota archaeon]|nr:hypothetical protein [Candidatus Lokiarchaeota archaeon]
MVDDKTDLVAWLRERPNAPRYNYEATDMLSPAFLREVVEFGRAMAALRGDPRGRVATFTKKLRGMLSEASKGILNYMELGALKVDLAALDGAALLELLGRLPLAKREDLAQRPWRHVPVNVPLDDMIVYRTAGTTAEPMAVPSHPVATGCYSPMLVEAMARWGVDPGFSPGGVGIALVGFQ